MFKHYDREGNEIDMVAWGKLLQDPKYKIVKQTLLPNGKWVSTVWIGLNHKFDWAHSDSDPRPIIFETMVFPKKGNFEDEYCERHRSEKDAVAEHAKIVKKFGG